MAERMSKAAAISQLSFVVTNGVTVEKGNEVFYELSTDKLVATPTANTIAVGIAFETVVGDGTKKASVILPAEWRAQWFTNDTGTAVAAGNRMGPCYFKDGGTVSAATTNGYPYAGIVLDLSTADGVLVGVPGEPGTLGGVSRTVTAPAFAANDLVLATVQNGAIYDIPATGAASTVTLPAAAIEGTIIYFAADGTKNGHTVQYRDATGPANLTTALTASKRHLTACAFIGGKWFANAYVSP